jgi:hypothetical protein
MISPVRKLDSGEVRRGKFTLGSFQPVGELLPVGAIDSRGVKDPVGRHLPRQTIFNWEFFLPRIASLPDYSLKTESLAGDVCDGEVGFVFRRPWDCSSGVPGDGSEVSIAADLYPSV